MLDVIATLRENGGEFSYFDCACLWLKLAFAGLKFRYVSSSSGINPSVGL